MKSIDGQLIKVITHDEYIFSVNNKKTYRWQCKRDIFLHSKKKKSRIIVSDFHLSFFSIYFTFLKKNKINLLNIVNF